MKASYIEVQSNNGLLQSSPAEMYKSTDKSTLFHGLKHFDIRCIRKFEMCSVKSDSLALKSQFVAYT